MTPSRLLAVGRGSKRVVMTNRAETGVVLPAGHTGSSLFHAVLAEAVAQFPRALANVRLPPTPAAFKREAGLALARFEAARVVAPERVDIARHLTRSVQHTMRFGTAGSSPSLADALREPAAAPAFESATLVGRPGLRAEVPLDGRRYCGQELLALLDRLYEAHQLSDGVCIFLIWVV